jgi:hypothetical protein
MPKQGEDNIKKGKKENHFFRQPSTTVSEDPGSPRAGQSGEPLS